MRPDESAGQDHFEVWSECADRGCSRGIREKLRPRSPHARLRTFPPLTGSNEEPCAEEETPHQEEWIPQVGVAVHRLPVKPALGSQHTTQNQPSHDRVHRPVPGENDGCNPCEATPHARVSKAPSAGQQRGKRHRALHPRDAAQQDARRQRRFPCIVHRPLADSRQQPATPKCPEEAECSVSDACDRSPGEETVFPGSSEHS